MRWFAEQLCGIQQAVNAAALHEAFCSCQLYFNMLLQYNGVKMSNLQYYSTELRWK